ncbi:D-alanyl-D-alanine carboxypeptidase/D-alanyl-D-alanine-endopeptidase [Thioclava sp. DLFJ5-1]|uniref:D-alanyl-D-alanine carboxypeptidase/D-alanyl-D-alanine endopeptidase n=1 Tax=Thioclava sp. DLFJ5-1 TaxID=1915314 RepID=UPI0009978EE0|nr:D-alanyl-D-alanine carboxypeptidase/D-alanyl-D-alanine-endopeptidase [Thioclava sp. DLFJ5-1]OOY19166.1 D-alanyl-D-alanine carboxypeptidase/D-alanyl-D-alanine-endopeptidase [Thioclava sp. DLFJ5-1]
MPLSISRRFALLGGAALFATPKTGFGQTVAAAELVRMAGLSGDVGYVVADLKSGQILEQRNAGQAMPPASALKSITSLYAMEQLGGDFRFGTQLIATGPISGGRIQGDLILAGGGDPTLTTDDLNAMAKQLAAKGVQGITGRFLTWAGALPYKNEIANDQPIFAGYNPSISGLMLNFNRVHFQWRRSGGGWALSMDARGRDVQPQAYTAKASIAKRSSPTFTYSDRGGVEHWTVASAALGRGGSRWLPVRHPAAYAGDVFQTLARAQGTPLPAPEEVRNLPGGTVLVSHGSDPLVPVLREMMKYSTNITAEAVGMTVSKRLGAGSSLKQSGQTMTQWLQQRTGARSARFTDHSGLRADAELSPQDMVAALRNLGAPMGLRSLMKPFKLRDATGKNMPAQPFRVDAKTGTLNFVSTLAGYMTAPDGTELVFAIFTADLNRRRRAGSAPRPPGQVQWVRASKILQSQLLERWAGIYG